MPNDTSTLSGALLEMKDQLISELADKGVTASYDPSTGLLGLIGRISDIQTGGSCYHIEFSEASYVAVGGSATLEIMLQENYAPKSGATVTVTGSDSSLYTGITNSSGIASVTVNNISSQTTFTATYSNVSTQCTVTVSNVLFYDDATTDKSSNYSGCITFRNTQACMGLTYESNNTRYKLTENGSKAHNLHIIPLDGYKNIKIEYDFYLSSTYCYFGFIMYKDGSDNVTWNLSHNELFKGQTTSGTYSESKVKSVSSVTDKWLHYEITVSNKELTMKLYKDDSLYHTETWTLSDTIWDNPHYGFAGWGNSGDKIAYFKNLVVESL